MRCLLAPLALALALSAAPRPSFTFNATAFLRDGAPFTILSAEIHYQRAHPGDWPARLALLRAAGFNTVTTYIEWALHEPLEGSFDFASPDRDIGAWLRAIADAGLLAIVRVGPYITAELDFGGLPFWLAEVPNIRLRTNDTVWLAKVDAYLDALCPQLTPFLYAAGGPIIMLQVEDDTDLQPAQMAPAVTHAYYAHLADGLRARGLGGAIINTLCNACKTTWCEHSCANSATPGTLLALEFSVGDVDPATVCSGGAFRAAFPAGPCLVLETYTAWYDQVGGQHADVAAGVFAEWIDALLSAGASVSVYMGFGGTNFGFLGGGDVSWNETRKAYTYAPMVTSYSYGAPVDESGRASDKWGALRAVFSRHAPVPPGPPPPPVPVAAPAAIAAPAACALLFDARRRRQQRRARPH